MDLAEGFEENTREGEEGGEGEVVRFFGLDGWWGVHLG
jgi:hypothetical protein